MKKKGLLTISVIALLFYAIVRFSPSIDEEQIKNYDCYDTLNHVVYVFESGVYEDDFITTDYRISDFRYSLEVREVSKEQFEVEPHFAASTEMGGVYFLFNLDDSGLNTHKSFIIKHSIVFNTPNNLIVPVNNQEKLPHLSLKAIKNYHFKVSKDEKGGLQVNLIEIEQKGRDYLDMEIYETTREAIHLESYDWNYVLFWEWELRKAYCH